MAGRDLRWGGVLSSASKAKSLGGVAQRGLGGMCLDGHAQDGCVVWHHGSVDDMLDKVIALITSEDGFAKDGGDGF